MNKVSFSGRLAYRLLSRLFFYPEKPSKDPTALTGQKVTEDLQTLGNASSVGKIGSLITLLEKARLEDLQLEYVALFDYRPTCPPYEGAFRDDIKRGDILIDLTKFYKKEGTDCSSTFFPDHISVELTFMHLLIFNEASFSDNNPEKMAAVLQTEKEFMDEHLLKWVPDFCDCINKNAELPFFTSLAMLTKEFILQDAEYIDSLLREL